MSSTARWVIAALTLAGCQAPTHVDPVEPTPIQIVSVDAGFPPDRVPVTALYQIDLRVALGLDDADVVGVAVDPQSGERIVAEATRGLYVLDAKGIPTRVWDPSSPSGLAAKVKPPLTDVVAIGHGLFAVTTRNEGYIIDPVSDEVVGHFCYVPSPGIGVKTGALPPDGDQLTLSLAFQPATADSSERIIAQPQTFERATGALLASHIAFFDPRSGEDQLWIEIGQMTFSTGAMAALPSGALLLAGGDSVLSMQLAHPTFIYFDSTTWSHDLALQRIDGLAVDAREQSLLVVDGPRQTLFAVPLAAVEPYSGGA